MKTGAVTGPQAKGELFKIELLLRENLACLDRGLSLRKEPAVLLDSPHIPPSVPGLELVRDSDWVEPWP